MKDYCETCGNCAEQDHGLDIEMVLCAQCGRTVCAECCDGKGLCCSCAVYDLPANFRITAENDAKTAPCQVWANSLTLADIPEPHKFWYDDLDHPMIVTISVRKWDGIGQHYHTDIKEDEDVVWIPQEKKWGRVKDMLGSWMEMKCNISTTDASRRFIRRTLIRRYGKKVPVVVIFASADVRKWFYKDGD